MTKRVIRDCISAFNLKRILEVASQKNRGFAFLYISVLLPMIMLIGNDPKDLIVYGICMTPIMCILVLVSLRPLRLTKIMYLCPLSPEKRTEYLKKSFFLLIFLTIIMECICILGLIVLGKSNLYHGIEFAINELVVIIYMIGLSNTSQTKQKNKMWFTIFTILVPFLSAIIAYVYMDGFWDSGRESGERDIELWFEWGVLIYMVVFMLPVTIKYLKFVFQNIIDAGTYESIYMNKEGLSIH